MSLKERAWNHGWLLYTPSSSMMKFRLSSIALSFPCNISLNPQFRHCSSWRLSLSIHPYASDIVCFLAYLSLYLSLTSFILLLVDFTHDSQPKSINGSSQAGRGSGFDFRNRNCWKYPILLVSLSVLLPVALKPCLKPHLRPPSGFSYLTSGYNCPLRVALRSTRCRTGGHWTF